MSKRKSATLDLSKPKPAEVAARPAEVDWVDEPKQVEVSVKPAWQRWLTTVVGLTVFVVMLFGGFGLVYAGKVYPGVTALGVPLGGLDRQAAVQALQKAANDYERELIPVQYDAITIRLNPAIIGTKYELEATVDQALAYGRQGSIWRRLGNSLQSLSTAQVPVAVFKYDEAKLASHIRELDTEVNRPVVNAALDFAAGRAQVKPAVPGRRLDFGLLVQMVNQRLGAASVAGIDAPVYELAPVVDAADLAAVKGQAEAYLSAPLKVSYGSKTDTVEPVEVIPWIKVSRPVPTVVRAFTVDQLLPQYAPVVVELDDGSIKAYVASLAKQIDQPGQDAALAITDGRASVFKPSRDGVELNQPAAVTAIKELLNKSQGDKAITLQVKVTKPSVTEDSLNNLGINELISEGVSMFPGSARERIQNVRVGAARFNGVLIKPGETFSFNSILGDVGPETGYAPARVILKDRQEIQYGGGLCQVSSTAFRAALNAGLPITARINHSYAVPYYTAPYGVPGVDATIYLPNPDFKFVNDTEGHILIQTILSGTTLKFQFYGTKKKEGRIRGPFFISGSLDATQPSKTVFYRDIVVNDQVVKTDTFYSSYKSSNDFPLAQFN